MWVHWLSGGARYHRQVRSFVASRAEAGERLAVVPQVLQEVLHVVTDGKRFNPPLQMAATNEALRRLWESSEVEQVVPGPRVFPRTLELLQHYRLGRKRILDTALAATLEEADVHHLATFNAADFRVFEFLEVIDPLGIRP